jgi:hypothetical protein
LGPLNELSVVSGFSQVGQSVFLMDNDVHSPNFGAALLSWPNVFTDS